MMNCSTRSSGDDEKILAEAKGERRSSVVWPPTWTWIPYPPAAELLPLGELNG